LNLPQKTLNLSDPDFLRNPYPTLEDLRETAPIFLEPNYNKVFFTRYDDIAALLRDKRLGRSILHVLSRDELGWPPPNPRQADFDAFNASHMLDREPPDHTRLRSLVSQVFTPRRVEGLLPRVKNLIGRTLDALEDRKTFDFVTDLAEPLPVAVIGELLGVPEEDQPLLRPWSAAIVKLYELGFSEAQQQQANTAVLEFSDYLRSLAKEREKHPRDDLITALIQARDGTDKLSEEEFISSCILLLNAGHEASVNGSSAAMLALSRDPEAKAQLVKVASSRRARTSESSEALPALFKTAVEEFLRFDTPLPMFERWVLEDLEFNGLPLERGQQIVLLYASGNRDPRKFVQPNTLLLERTPNLHLTFGLGIHYCLGAPLARLEMGLLFKSLLERFPEIQVHEDSLEYGGGFVIRGISRLEVGV
jgi:cytochrome P450